MGKFENKAPKKKANKGLLICLPVLLILLAAAVALVAMNYHIVSGRLYPKDAIYLNLRSEKITAKQYERISAKLPECEIRWSIPFQDGTLADDAKEITVSTLTEADVAQLTYARQLKRVNAEGCSDYEALELLRKSRPELEVNYSVALSSGNQNWDADTLALNSVTEADVHH